MLYMRYEPEKPLITLSELNPNTKALRRMNLNAKQTMRARRIKEEQLEQIEEITPQKQTKRQQRLDTMKSLEQSFPEDELSLMSIPRQSLHQKSLEDSFQTNRSLVDQSLYKSNEIDRRQQKKVSTRKQDILRPYTINN